MYGLKVANKRGIMIKIAVCDDEQKQHDLMNDFFVQYQNNHPHIDMKVSMFNSSLEMLSSVEESGGFDIYFLDVYMAGILGTQAAKQLRDEGDQGQIIFTTSSRDHALEAFEVEASHYLVKPFTMKAMSSLMDKAFELLNIERRHFISLKTNKGFVRVYTRDIVFTEPGKNNYQLIHLSKNEVIEVRMTASELFELLEQGKVFVRCGVSININLRYVRQITKESIVFDTGEHISYPYRAYQKLKEEFLSFQLSEDR